MSRRERRIARKAFGATIPELVRMGKLAKAGARFAERVFERGRRVAITAGIPKATNIYELTGTIDHIETED